MDALTTALEADAFKITREVAEHLGIAQSTVVGHMHRLSFVLKDLRWVSHRLGEQNLVDWAHICHSLLFRQNSELFLKHLKTGYKMWIYYKNVEQKGLIANLANNCLQQQNH